MTSQVVDMSEYRLSSLRRGTYARAGRLAERTVPLAARAPTMISVFSGEFLLSRKSFRFGVENRWIPSSQTVWSIELRSYSQGREALLSWLLEFFERVTTQSHNGQGTADSPGPLLRLL